MPFLAPSYIQLLMAQIQLLCGRESANAIIGHSQTVHHIGGKQIQSMEDVLLKSMFLYAVQPCLHTVYYFFFYLPPPRRAGHHLIITVHYAHYTAPLSTLKKFLSLTYKSEPPAFLYKALNEQYDIHNTYFDALRGWGFE